MSSSQQKSVYHLIEFRQGASPPVQLTNWSDPISGYTAEPRIEIEVEGLTGTFDNESCTITLPVSDFVESLSTLGRTEPVRVVVTEIQLDPNGAIAASGAVFGGTIAQVIRNPDGITSLARLECQGIKNRLDTPMGLQATPTCPWRFLGRGCELQIVNFTYQANVLSIDSSGFQVIVSGLPSVPDDEWFANGYLTFKGVRVDIKYWNQQVPGLLYVRQIPPASWVGQQVVVVSGCLKRVEDCRARNNESQFGGIGIKIPAYSPQFETGTYEVS